MLGGAVIEVFADETFALESPGAPTKKYEQSETVQKTMVGNHVSFANNPASSKKGINIVTPSVTFGVEWKVALTGKLPFKYINVVSENHESKECSVVNIDGLLNHELPPHVFETPKLESALKLIRA